MLLCVRYLQIPEVVNCTYSVVSKVEASQLYKRVEALYTTDRVVGEVEVGEVDALIQARDRGQA